MTQSDHAPVERLYLRLTEALQRSRRDPYETPVTVAEIYQELIPYRVVRSDAGFDMNADYEHALLRMLAGEGERVRVEPAHAAEEMQRELRNANPNLSVYRMYAACDAWVSRPSHDAAFMAQPASHDANHGAASEPADAPRPAQPVADEVAAASGAGRFALAEEESTSRSATASAVPENDRAPRGKAVAAAPSLAADSASRPVEAEIVPVRGEAPRVETARCAYCDSELPPQRAARFCPYCGADQTTRPCPACGEVIEPGWVFCIACGASAQ